MGPASAERGFIAILIGVHHGAIFGVARSVDGRRLRSVVRADAPPRAPAQDEAHKEKRMTTRPSTDR